MNDSLTSLRATAVGDDAPPFLGWPRHPRSAFVVLLTAEYGSFTGRL
jgi:hypothetical protein